MPYMFNFALVLLRMTTENFILWGEGSFIESRGSLRLTDFGLMKNRLTERSDELMAIPS